MGRDEVRSATRAADSARACWKAPRRTATSASSAFETEDTIYQAVRAGAAGFLAKSAPRPEMIQAIHTVCRSKPSVSHETAIKVADRLHRPDLSPREIQVPEELVKGSSNKIIAGDPSISENTVELHVTRIMQKLGAKDRTHDASLALQRGILDRWF